MVVTSWLIVAPEFHFVIKKHFPVILVNKKKSVKEERRRTHLAPPQLMAENQHFHVELKDLAPHLSKLLNHEVNCHIRKGVSTFMT